MKKKTYYQVATLVFAVITAGHLARIVYGWDAVISGVDIPMWVSWAAVLIAGYLSVRGWQFVKKS